jgi:chromosomal replication initiation ATPase DnaA
MSFDRKPNWRSWPEPILRTSKRIATEHLLTMDGIVSKSRHPRVTRARDHLLAILRWSTFYSYPELGFLLAMDHTSVIAAVRRHEARLNNDIEQYQQQRRRG